MSVESQPASSITLESKVSRAITSGFELLARTSFGQGVLKVVDRGLYVVEASTQWSLPPRQVAIEENGKSSEKIELARPLPWILFLPTLIFLRSIRLCVNIIAPLFGFSQIEPSDTISCMQKYRRRLRNILFNSTKDSQGPDAILTGSTVRSGARSALKGMGALFCSGTRKSPSPPPTRIITSRPRTPESKDTKEMLPRERIEEEQKGDEVEEEKQDDEAEEVGEEEEEEDSKDLEEPGKNENLLEKIDRIALDSSAADSDFDPGNFSDSDDSEEVEEEEGEDLSKSEIEDLKADQVKEINVPNQKKSEKVAEKRGKYLADKSEQKEVAFYSPISSKSVSPERSISPIRRGSTDQHNFGSVENRDVNCVPQNPNLVNTSTFPDDGTSYNVTNGRTEEKQKKKSCKIHHHKVKKSNCRKRK